MRNSQATTTPPSRSIRRSVAAIVPPVASRSSTTRTCWPLPMPSSWMASTSRPYSSSYSSSITAAGSLPFLRTGTKPAPSSCASTPPKMKPRDSTPTTTSMEPFGYFAARCSMTDAHAGASLSSVVMSLKRMPSVGKSLMSRILARSAATSMTERDVTRRPGTAQYEKPFSARKAAHEVAEVGDDQVGVRGAGPAGGGVVDTAHPRALRSPHVGDGIVADVGRFARVDTELRQGSPEDLGVGLAVADLVRIRDRSEVAQEVVPFQDPSQDDAERDPARGELTHRVLGPGLQVGRQLEHRLDVAGDGLLEESGGHGVPRPRRRRLEHEAHLLGDRRIAVPAPEALDQHVLRPVVGVHHVGQAEHAAGAAENPVERADAEQPLVAHIFRRVMDERFPEIERDGAEHGHLTAGA